MNYVRKIKRSIKSEIARAEGRLGRPKMTPEEHLGKGRGFVEPPVDKVSYQEAREAIIQLYEIKGPTAAEDLIRSFGVYRLSELDEKHYHLVVDRVRSKLNPA
jgi:hypothetical protein